MSILKSALEESILSKSEIAALRALSRANMLADGLDILRKLELQMNSKGYNPTITAAKIKEYEKYLMACITSTLIQHRLPAVSPDET